MPFGFGSFEPYALHVFSTPGNLSASQVLVEEPDDELPQIALRRLQVKAMGRTLDDHELVLDADLLKLVGERWIPRAAWWCRPYRAG